MAIEDARLLALIGGTDEERLAAVRGPDPAGADAVEAFLVAAERSESSDVRQRAAFAIARATWRDAALLDASGEARLLAVAERHADPDVLRGLSGATPPRRCAEVLRIALARRVHRAPYLLDSLRKAAREGALGADAVVARFEDELDVDGRRALLGVAESALRREGHRELRAWLLRTLLRVGPREVRVDACWALHRLYDRPHGREEEAFVLAPEEITALFGAPRNALTALTALLRDPEMMREMAVQEWIQKLLKYGFRDGAAAMFAEEPRAVDELVAALLETAQDAERWALLRTAAVEAIERLVPALDARGGTADRLEAFLAKEPGFELEYWARRVARRLRGEPLD